MTMMPASEPSAAAVGDEDPSLSKRGADRYLKREVLGEGTYGVVFKAIDTKTGQTVAIKKIRLGKYKEGVNFTALREIKLLKELKDPNITVTDMSLLESTWLDVCDAISRMALLNQESTTMSQTHTGQTVAIKKIRLGKYKEGVNFTALREIKLLKELKDPNIIELSDAFPHKGNLHLVFEFMESDLEAVIRDRNIVLSPADIKSYLQMTLKGLAYCHKKWVLHRDMKPNNLLIAADGQLKLADFGLARIFGSPDRKFTHQVFARWYRAPELLFGTKQYGAGVDVWAAGCIFAELLLRRPFLQGSSDIDQLGKIFAAFGTPKPSQWPDMVYLPDYVEYQYVPAPPLRSLFPMASDDALDLLSKMFTYDPKARISVQQALEHRYFSSVPAPTKPSLLPRPPRKGDSLNHRPSEFNSQEGPLVLSPPRKLRRVTVHHHEGLEGNVYQQDKADEHLGEEKHGETTGQSGNMPMSIDLGAVFGSRPIPRPTLNSADRSHLKRKLDLDAEFEYPQRE